MATAGHRSELGRRTCDEIAREARREAAGEPRRPLSGPSRRDVIRLARRAGGDRLLAARIAGGR